MLNTRCVESAPLPLQGEGRGGGQILHLSTLNQSRAQNAYNWQIMTRIVLILLAGLLLVSACGPAESTPALPDPAVTRTSTGVEPAQVQPAQNQAPGLALDPALDPLLDPSLDAATQTPLPSSPTPTGIPAATATPSQTPPPTATPPIPRTIEYQRHPDYPPTRIRNEHVLHPGATKQR